MKIPGPKYRNTEFDGFKEIPWDFKAYTINTSSHNDDKRTFQKWHEELKGGE